MSQKGKGADQKEQETSFGGEDASTVVHEVDEVYVYIPPELSAAGVELKIVGSVRVINKVGCAAAGLGLVEYYSACVCFY